MIKAVLFDMNGIIINDEHIHELAFKQTLRPYDILITHQDYILCCVGKTDRAGYELISTQFSKKLPIDKLLEDKANLYLKLFPEHKKTYPNVIELIHSLAKNFILGLTSSSSRQEVDLIITEFQIKDKFFTTISGNDVLNGKPNPEPYIKTSDKIGVPTNECLVIEDSRSGVESAKSAGCFCIGVTTTHSKEDLKDADAIVDNFAEINMQLINSLSIK